MKENISEEIILKTLRDIFDINNIDIDNIGKSLAEKENKWYNLLSKVKTKESGILLIKKLEFIREEIKKKEYFEYANIDIRKKEYEVIKSLIPFIKNNSIEVEDLKKLLYEYIEKNVGLKNFGFKVFLMPIIPDYKNIDDSNLEDMIKIIGLENEFNKEL